MTYSDYCNYKSSLYRFLSHELSRLNPCQKLDSRGLRCVNQCPSCNFIRLMINPILESEFTSLLDELGDYSGNIPKIDICEVLKNEN